MASLPNHRRRSAAAIYYATLARYPGARSDAAEYAAIEAVARELDLSVEEARSRLFARVS